MLDDLVLINDDFLAEMAATALIVKLVDDFVGNLIAVVGIFFVDDVSQLHVSVKLILY